MDDRVLVVKSATAGIAAWTRHLKVVAHSAARPYRLSQGG